MDTDAGKDFFISYTSADKKWAEWIAWQLEEAQYSTILQAWDFQPGMNFVLEMDKAASVARCTLVVLSPAYLNARYTQPEWAVAFRRDPKSEQGAVLPVQVQKCEVEGLLGPIVYIDLVDLDEAAAHESLLAGVRRERGKPETAPRFPGRAQHTISEPQRFPGALPLIWNIPYRRNPFFTGREDLLERLHSQLQALQKAVLSQPQAISGLGGIGKTQLAVEYAYQYREAYRFVFWTRAATRETLIADFVTIADLLHLSEKYEQDQNLVIEAVKRWFATYSEWLLILDNADDVAMVSDFVPTDSKGHIVLTSRAQAFGSLAQRIDVEKMGMVEGSLFLLHRAKILSSDAFLDQASEEDLAGVETIVIEMDFLPLALDQAGAYIDEIGCSLSDYLDLYRTHRKELLQRRSHLPTDHPEPVATTWSLSFQKVEQANRGAADLLRLCAFLDPDTIPEDLISEGSPHFGPVLQRVAPNALKLNKSIEELRKFSLIQCNPSTRTLSVHRLVQAVLKDVMKKDMQRRWAERTVRVVNAVFPEEVEEAETWQHCQRYLPQVQACTVLMRDYNLAFEEAAHLLNRAGVYLQNQALYEQAELLQQQARAMYIKLLGTNHPLTAKCLHDLAELYSDQGKYDEAEALYQQALAIREQALGPNHLDTAHSLMGLAEVYRNQVKFPEAEPLYRRALIIFEQTLGPDHPDVADNLTALSNLYGDLGQYDEAEPLLQQALAIYEKISGSEHIEEAHILNNLAILYDDQGRFSEAEKLYQRALDIYKRIFGPEHSELADTLNNLAAVYDNQGKFAKAEAVYWQALQLRKQALTLEQPTMVFSFNNLVIPYDNQDSLTHVEQLYQQALAIRKQALEAEHATIAAKLNNIALLYESQGKLLQAEQLYQQALVLRQKALGPEHADVANCMSNLAGTCLNQGKYIQAERLSEQAVAILEKALGPEHPDVALGLLNLSEAYCFQGEYARAERTCKRALKISKKALGSKHPQVALCLNTHADLNYAQGKFSQAESLYQQAIKLRVQELGSKHPDVAQSLMKLVLLYHTQEKYTQAEPLNQQLLKIFEHVLGLANPQMALNLNTVAELYYAQEKYTQAESLYQRALTIAEKQLGSEHPITATIRENYNALIRNMKRKEIGHH